MTKQREIKYKAWNLVDYGEPKDYFYQPANTMVDWKTIQGNKNKWFNESEFGKKFILLQYTGLTDKHGKEIYEEDIVNYMGKNLIVEWSECRWAFVYPNNEDVLDGFYVHTYKLNKKMEVIGNIYENKNLLKQNKPMTKNNYTSLELTKKLLENGCNLESEYLQDNIDNIYTNTMPRIRISDATRHDGTTVGCFYPAYDILNEICVKYAKEFFGEGSYRNSGETNRLVRAKYILYLLQQNKKQEAEDYIWENCLFNPNNKNV